MSGRDQNKIYLVLNLSSAAIPNMYILEPKGFLKASKT